MKVPILMAVDRVSICQRRVNEGRDLPKPLIPPRVLEKGYVRILVNVSMRGVFVGNKSNKSIYYRDSPPLTAMSTDVNVSTTNRLNRVGGLWPPLTPTPLVDTR